VFCFAKIRIRIQVLLAHNFLPIRLPLALVFFTKGRILGSIDFYKKEIVTENKKIYLNSWVVDVFFLLHPPAMHQSS
jgi:hypothetical protein